VYRVSQRLKAATSPLFPPDAWHDPHKVQPGLVLPLSEARTS